MTEETEDRAEEVYVLLKKNYRISRNIRLLWFFNNILKDIETLPKVIFKNGQIDDTNGHEIQILSWKLQRPDVREVDIENETSETIYEDKHDDDDELEEDTVKCTLQPETKVNFLSRGYRLIFALDLSPSIFRIDAESHRTVAESVLSRLADCLCCLVHPFKVPNSDDAIQPNIYITVFAQARPSHKSRGRYKQDVIVQGCLLTPKSLLTILNAVECKIYHEIKSWNQPHDIVSTQPVRHDHGLVSILRTGLLALQLLPSNTSAGIIVLTDGVVGMPDMAVLETLLNQLRSTTTSCSFLHLRSSQAVFCDYGYSANIDLLKFVSAATYGTFFEQFENNNNNLTDGGMNIYQKGLLVWQFQLEDDKSLSSDFENLPDVRNWDPDTDLTYTPTQKNMYISPLLRKKHFERALRVSIFTLLSVRLREGYMISSMSLGKNGNQLEVILVYPWNHGASIKYIASSAWPVVRNMTKVEVYIEATYEFLYDVTVGLGHENWGRYRSMAVRRFKHFMKGLSQTDHMMTHLVSFTTDPVYYTISQKHVPLFYLPPNSNQLVLSMPSMNDSSKSMFAGYWKPVLSLDINIWQKWMHTHHIDIILQHDVPLPKHLHIATKSGRFHSIQTSTAMSQLTSLLREWCTFVLLENHSYVKFTHKENEDKPSSFYVVRLSSKSPVVVIRLAFQIGTPGPYRNQILTDLRDRVLGLTFPSISKQSSNLNVRTSGVRSRNPSGQTRTRHVSGPERTCTVLVHKPLDRILIHYDHTPRDFMQPPSSGYRHGKVGSSNASTRSGRITGGEVGSTSMMQDLCRYMEHNRWVWSITNKSLTPIPETVAGQMASLLIKLRLSEGFNFASTSSGVICMVREFPMILNKEDGNETSYCMAQFIMFPPTVCTSRESFSLDGSEDEEDTAEADGELFLATEMWIEPQCGFVSFDSTSPYKSVESTHSRHSSGVIESGRSSRLSSTSSSATTTTFNISQPNQRFLGSTYRDIPKVVANEDRLLLSILSTIEHLRLICVPKTYVLSTLPQQVNKPDNEDENQLPRSRKPSSQSHLDGQYSGSPTDREPKNTHPVFEGITHYPCLFDLVSLLDRCPRVKLLFMTLSQNINPENGNFQSPNICLFDFFHQSLSKISDKEAILSDIDSINITKHMIKRDEDTNLFKGEVASESDNEDDDIPKMKWKCYLKVLPKGKIMVTLLPSTFEDLEEFAASMPDLTSAKVDVMQNIAEELPVSPSNLISPTHEKKLPSNPNEVLLNRDDYRLARRRSIKRITSVNSNKSEDQIKQEQPENIILDQQPQPQINLPVFVYQCSTTNIVEQLLKDPSSVPHNISSLDIEQDYRIKSVDSKIEAEPSSKHRFFRSQSYPFHQTPATSFARNDGFFSTPEDVFGSSQHRITDPDASSLCETLVDAYHRCFVRAVAKNLKLTGGSNIASIDVQAATDAICLESVQEIDITQFLLITCPQVATFKDKHLSKENIDQRDHDDVFSMDVGPHIPVARVEPMIRHTSSTSSATDPATQSNNHTSQKKSSSESPEQKTRGSKNQVSGINRQHDSKDDGDVEDVNDEPQKESATNNIGWKTGSSEKSTASVRSAFKKLRKRPQSLPKPGGVAGKEISDTDGDTPESEAIPSFTHMSSNMSAASLKQESNSGNTGSLPRSLKITKPLKKLQVNSKVGWEDLPEFPVNLLKESHPRHISGTDDQVKMNFLNLLSQNFCPVRTMPDIFYYKVQDDVRSEDNHEQDHDNADHRDYSNQQRHRLNRHLNVINHDLVTESDLDVKFEIDENDLTTEADMQSQHLDRPSTMSSDCNIGNISSARKIKKKKKQSRFSGDVDLTEDFQHDTDDDSSLSSSSCSFFDDEDDFSQANIDEDVPLFLCMTCTVRDKKTGNHGTMPVEGLPTNLQSVLSNLERPCETIDLSQLYVTLDLIWMTLPAESIENDLTPDVHDHNRFSSGLLPEEDDSPRHEVSKKERINTVHDEQETVDPLYMLPAPCLSSVNSTKDQIEWLLKDEIISALRTCESIDSSTLEKVTAHIDESDRTNCMVEITNLQFVFGADKSLPLFNIEFERMFKDFKGYRMKKEGEYYYFTTERSFIPIPNWRNVPFLGENDVFRVIDQQHLEVGGLPTTGNITNVGNVYQSVTGSTSSGGKAVQEIIKSSAGNEHVTLRRTKTEPNSLRSPPVTIRASTKSCTSLPISGCPIHSSLSFRSLPNNEIMSVDAIESDVAIGTESSASTLTKQTSSSKSTPVRKSSALDIVSPDISSPNNNCGLSPYGQRGVTKYVRGGQSRLSLPNAITSDMCQDGRNMGNESRRGNRRGPIKQRSVESNLNMSGRLQLKRHSTHTVTPLSLRNSPQQYSGPTSPMVRHLSGHNSSFGSSGSAPNCRRRSAHNVTPIPQLVQRDITSGEPSSSTPVLRRDNSGGNESVPVTPATAIPNSAYLFDGGCKDAMSSPVSISDGEHPRYSIASWFESGYDGEESDIDGEDDYMASLHDSANDLPSFWLIVHVLSDRVKTYFHRRSSAVIPDGIETEHKRIFNAVIEYIHTTCKRINQTLLLNEMHDSRMCNVLLVEETEEDIWKRDYHLSNFSHSDDPGDDNDRSLLADTLKNAPGQFACEAVLETAISIHPRLKATGNIPGKSSNVMAVVRDLVINFMVTNRKNMFVYRLLDKSVFYCRMEEDVGGKPDSRRSSQLIHSSTDTFGNDPADRRTSKESLTSVGLAEPKSGGTLTLKWHGVGPLLPQQQEELEKMNQIIVRRLSESVLEKITVILQRNSKLSSSDVQFIQPSVASLSSTTTMGSPATSQVRQVSPSATLSYGLPDEFCSCLPAVRYYLHQNLLQFMSMPRYVDATQLSSQFIAYKMAPLSADDIGQKTTDSSVFLFYQTLEPGKTGYGIACIVLELTDVDGKPVSSDIILKFNAPEKSTTEQLLNLTEVADTQQVILDLPRSRSNTPAMLEQPSSRTQKKCTTPVKTYVRFHIWLKGSLTVDNLDKRLHTAVRHSLFDAVTELLILRPPLCDLHELIKNEDDVAPLDFQKSKKPSTKQNVVGKKSSPAMPDRRKSASAQAEEGEIGNLREVYKELSKTWFDEMEKYGCPSVLKLSMEISSMSQMKNVLQDIQKISGNILAECRVKSFICVPGSTRMSAFSFEKIDLDRNKSNLPGKYPTYTLIARNFLLWRKAAGCFTQAGQQTTSKTTKFPPYDSMIKPEQSPRPHEHRLSAPCAAYIPRQQFVIISLETRSIKVWGYNMSNETARNLQVKLSHCVDFHNARRRALDCITFQKLSLFRHCTFQSGFSQQTTKVDKKGDSHINSFTQDVKDVDLVLINSKLPSENKLQSQQKSKSNKRVFFNEAYLSNTPVKPLHITYHNKDLDVATQYAHQYLEMKANLKKRGEEQQHLHRVFSNWRERPGSISNMSITKDVLQVLLKHSRVIHHVTSPILFNLYWRKQILKMKNFPDAKDSVPSDQHKDGQVTKRQKRLSGVIRKSGDFTGKSYEDAKSRSRSNSARKDNTNKGSKGNLAQLVSDSLDETRYDTDELRKSLMMHYVQYWQSMNFILVKDDKLGRTDKLIRKSSSVDKSSSKHKKSRTNQSTKPKIEDISEKKVDKLQPLYLYRVSAGGIVIVDISCVGMNFLVKLHVIEASRLQYQQNLNQQMTVLFLNDCEHLKDDTHVHSFTYDFHLRYIQMYVQERQTAIKPGYHLVSLLRDFIEYYRIPPLFVFNQIYQGTVEAPCSHVTAEELYEYVVGKQAAHHGFKTLKLIDSEVTKNEHALVSSHLICGQSHSSSCNKEEHDMYDVGYVIWHDINTVEEKKVKLNFFVLFTNRRHLFPRFDRMENHHPIFPVRRGSSNLMTRMSQEKIQPILSDKIMSAQPGNVINVKQQVQSPTSSQSTSSLQKLANQVASPEHSTQKQTRHLSPVSTRKFVPSQARESFMKVKSPTESVISPTYSQENVFYTAGPPTVAKMKLLSQGRRQSMPNVGTLPLGVRQRNPQDRPRHASEFLEMQNSAGHSVKSAIDDNPLLQDEDHPSFVQCELDRLKYFLTNICASAEIQCYRNQLWDKVYMYKPSQNKTSMLPVEDFEHLLKHCQEVPLKNLDHRGHDLCNLNAMGIQWAIGLQKLMLNKFDQICRFFSNGDGTKRYLGVLNPKLYFMMLLITVDTVDENIGMFVVMRDKCQELDKEEPDLTTANPIFIPLKQHINNMIDFICYYTWTTLLSN